MPETSLILRAKDFTKQAFGQIQQSLNKTADHFNKLAVESKQMEKGLVGSLNKVKASLEANREGFQAIAIGAGAVAAGTGLLAKSFVDAAMRMEKMKMGLTAVMGSAEGAEEQFARLREVAKLPGLGLQEAIQGATRLQVVGTSAEEAARQLTAFGSSVARAGGGREELARVVEQIAQMASKSEVLMEDFRPIVSIMPDIVKAMNTAFGTKSIEQIREMGITSQKFIAGVTTELLKLPGVGNTAANAMENLNDSMFILRSELGQFLLPVFSKIINAVSSVVTWINNLSDTRKSLLAWGTVAISGIATLTAGISALVLALPGLIAGFTTLVALLPSISASLAAFAVGPGGIVMASVASLIALHFALKQLSNTMVEMIERQTVVATAMKDFGTLTDAEIIRKMTNAAKVIEQYDTQLLKLQEDEKKNVAVIDDVVKKRDELIKIYQDLQNVQKQRQVKKEAGGEEDLKLRQRELELIENRYEKERQQAKLTAEEKIAGYKKEIKDVEQLNKAITIERRILTKTLTDIDRKEAEERTKIAEKEAKERQDNLNTWIRDRVQAGVLATNAELQEIKKRKIAEQIVLEEMLLPYFAHEEQIKASQERIRKGAMQEVKDDIQAQKEASKIKIGITDTYFKILQAQREQNQKAEEIVTNQGVQEYERRMREHDHATEKILENSKKEVQAFAESVEKQKKLRDELAPRIAEQVAEIPFDFVDVLRQRQDLEAEAQENIRQLSEDTSQKIKDIQKDETLSYIEKLRAIEQAEIESAEKRKQIEQDLNNAKSASFKGFVQSTLQGIADIIAAEAKRQLAAQLSPYIGGALAVLGPAGMIAGMALPMIVGGFDNPKHDAIAKSAGFLYGTSFDNPTSDLQAQLRGTMSASKDLGERSAKDMVTHFSKGFEQGAAGQSQGMNNNQLQGVLGKLEQRLSETPQYNFYLDGQQLHASVRRRDDKTNFRRSAY